MRPTWFEVPTKDPEASKAFYKRVLGWQFEEHGGMIMFKDDSGAFGHLWPLEGKLPKWAQVGLYIDVKSIAIVLGKAQRAGGSVVQEKTKLPGGMGSVGMFADPLGVVWGLHSQK
jgi:predicted enzyme related to lactoylglutathione lyase